MLNRGDPSPPRRGNIRFDVPSVPIGLSVPPASRTFPQFLPPLPPVGYPYAYPGITGDVPPAYRWDEERGANAAEPTRTPYASMGPYAPTLGPPILKPYSNYTMATAGAPNTPYKSRFDSITLTGFFGASLTWATVFTGSRGSLEVITWAAVCFTLGAVCAACMGSIADSYTLQFEMDVRRFLRASAILSAMFVYAGVVLVWVAVITLGSVDTVPKPSIAILQTAGIVGIVAPSLCVALALYLRFGHGIDRWKF